MVDITVRPETEDDIKAIDVVNISAFQGENEAQLVTALRALPGYDRELSLVAEFNGRIVGHLMLTPITLHQRDQDVKVLALAPMSVVPSQSHRGIGSELVAAALAKAKSRGDKVILVAGHPEFYIRFGFKNALDWDIRCNLPVPDDALLLMELKEGVLHKGGTVNYPAPFLECY